MMLFLGATQGIMYREAPGSGGSKVEQVAPLMDGGLFVLISSYLKKFPENCFVGIRIPWTLASEKAWNRTHRPGRWVLIMAGALTTVSAFSPDAMNVLIVVVGKVAIIPFLYSP